MAESNRETAILESLNDPAIADPLSEVTRGERKALLIASLVGMAIAKGGLIPTQIEALGIDLSQTEVKSLLYITALVLAYLLMGFFLYSSADIRQRRLKIAASRARARPIIQEAMASYEQKKTEPSPDPNDPNRSLIESLGPLTAIADQTKLATELLTISTFRLIFEVHLPIAVGLVALILVLTETRGFPGWRIAALLLGIAVAVTVVVTTWRKRKKIVRWFGVRRNRYFMWKVKRITKRIGLLTPGSSEHVRLQAQARSYLDRAIKGPWV
jgi:hypothetical protein